MRRRRRALARARRATSGTPGIVYAATRKTRRALGRASWRDAGSAPGATTPGSRTTSARGVQDDFLARPARRHRRDQRVRHGRRQGGHPVRRPRRAARAASRPTIRRPAAPGATGCRRAARCCSRRRTSGRRSSSWPAPTRPAQVLRAAWRLLGEGLERRGDRRPARARTRPSSMSAGTAARLLRRAAEAAGVAAGQGPMPLDDARPRAQGAAGTASGSTRWCATPSRAAAAPGSSTTTSPAAPAAAPPRAAAPATSASAGAARRPRARRRGAAARPHRALRRRAAVGPLRRRAHRPGADRQPGARGARPRARPRADVRQAGRRRRWTR